MLSKEQLERYKLQNPKKYALKFGNLDLSNESDVVESKPIQLKDDTTVAFRTAINIPTTDDGKIVAPVVLDKNVLGGDEGGTLAGN